VAGHHGSTLFTDFVGELQSDQKRWGMALQPDVKCDRRNFKLARLDLTSGDQTTIQNAGGETHTFTRVNNSLAVSWASSMAYGKSRSGPRMCPGAPGRDTSPATGECFESVCRSRQDRVWTNGWKFRAAAGSFPLECCVHPGCGWSSFVHEKD